MSCPLSCGVGLLAGNGPISGRGVRVTAMAPEVVVERMRGVEEGVVFMGVAFRELPCGTPGDDYFSRATVDFGGAPITDTAFMGLTS